jgi:hypothetical protein
MLESIGKIQQSAKSRTGLIFIPAEIMVDSNFPIRVPSAVKIRIINDKLVIEGVNV